MLLIWTHPRRLILWQITGALDADSIETYHRNRFVSRAYTSPISSLDPDPPRARSDILLRGLHRDRWRRTCKKLTGKATDSLDHMSETNDAHVTRWRHGSRGIAVLNADCSPNTLAAFVLVHSIQIMSAEIVDPASSKDSEIDDMRGVPNVSFD